ncbi:MAG: 50S ribosomal protein L23 [Candidatus Amoebophilus sp. 36-38]|nr:MAG: 50S ribosomal protein L23 [Candidatus Amoebophilus sp. 36-38]
MSILQKPLVTEKVTSLNDKGIYGFIVDNRANKVEIKKEIEELYGVTVLQINTMRYAGKKKVRYTKSGVNKGKRVSYKKAIVTLKSGSVIDFYENV